MKRTTIRNAFTALSVAVVLGSTASQAAQIDNREIGHIANAQSENVNVQGLATGLQNGQVGHFAAKVGSTVTSYSAYGATEHAVR